MSNINHYETMLSGPAYPRHGNQIIGVEHSSTNRLHFVIKYIKEDYLGKAIFICMDQKVHFCVERFVLTTKKSLKSSKIKNCFTKWQKLKKKSGLKLIIILN